MTVEQELLQLKAENQELKKKISNLIMSNYKWYPIEDLPLNWSELASSQLQSLASVWKQQAGTLQESDVLKQFNERLSRKWAIETGIIENLYSIDRGITQLLIEKGIETSLIPFGTTDKPAEQIVPLLKSQEEALEGLFAFVAQKRDLSISYIRELHQVLTRQQATVRGVNTLGEVVDVPLRRGDWKKLANNATLPKGEGVHEYCPPEQVASEMDQLVTIHKAHVEKSIPPEVEAAWLHHRFTQIHPFQDGNGRVARALASLIFIRAGWFPLVVDRDSRSKYLTCLEKADEGDLGLLISFFSELQTKAFLGALSLSTDLLRENEPDPLKQVLDATIDRLRARKLQSFQQMQTKAFDLSKVLEDSTFAKLEPIASLLDKELKFLDFSFHVEVGRSNENTDFWFRREILGSAKKLNYYADTRTYRKWVRLKIKEVTQAELVFSFHSLGFNFVGVMLVSAFMIYRDRGEDGEPSTSPDYPLCDYVFQFSYNEDKQEVLQRYQEWLNEALLVGLNRWRKQL
ncbi:MAG: Fic family protein [Chloroflexi bacterium]|nr:Fic family protein [Chloroflexota bacterium]